MCQIHLGKARREAVNMPSVDTSNEDDQSSHRHALDQSVSQLVGVAQWDCCILDRDARMCPQLSLDVNEMLCHRWYRPDSRLSRGRDYCWPGNWILGVGIPNRHHIVQVKGRLLESSGGFGKFCLLEKNPRLFLKACDKMRSLWSTLVNSWHRIPASNVSCWKIGKCTHCASCSLNFILA